MIVYMKIIYDNIIFTLQRHGGISVVWNELLKRIIKNGLDYICTNCSNEGNSLSLNDIIPDEKKEKLRSKKYLNAIRYLSCKKKRNYKYIFHSSYYRFANDKNAINITTVHDFTYELYNKGLRKWIHSWQKRRAVKHSDYIICISENTKNDMFRFYPKTNKDRVKVIYNGVSEDYLVCDSSCNNIIPFKKNSYILFVGSRAEYKNFDLTVKAVAKTKYNLVIVGAPLNKKEEDFVMEHFKKEERFFCAQYIDNKALNTLYNNAFALLYPSEYEGFGIPVIEAQKAGCPVIAYNGSSIPEIIGDSTLLINTTQTEDDIINKIKLIENTDLKNEIITKGLENSKRFSWDKMYEETLNLYELAWNNKKQK